MERIIISPERTDNTITTYELSNLIDDEGIILVYKDSKVVGSVVYNSGEYIMNTFLEFRTYYDFRDLLKDYPLYTFKFITE